MKLLPGLGKSIFFRRRSFGGWTEGLSADCVERLQAEFNVDDLTEYDALFRCRVTTIYGCVLRWSGQIDRLNRCTQMIPALQLSLDLQPSLRS